MYDNIGEKIKLLAKIIFFVEAIALVILGIVLMEEELVGLGFLLMVIGPLFAWVSSWLLYGYGEIIEKLGEIERNTHKGYSKAKTKKFGVAEQNKGETVEKIENKTIEKSEIERIMEEIEYIDVVCPQCGEKLSFEEGTEEFQCLYCDCIFKKV